MSIPSTYIDQAELAQSYYNSLSHPSICYHEQLTKWIGDDSKHNGLILIQSPSGEGKKAFLANWLQTTLPRRKDIKATIIRFGSFLPNFSESIYKTLTKLRELLDICQKIELTQETLRKYFPYWLDVCSKTLEHNSVSEGLSYQQKIILVFQGIDQMVDSKGAFVMPNFWLPDNFPGNIKVIASATTGSKAAKQLVHGLGRVIDYKCPQETRERLLSTIPTTIVSRIKALNPSLKYLNLLRILIRDQSFCKHFYSNLDNLSNFEAQGLLMDAINYWTKHFNRKPVRLILSLISYSKKGLTKEEIQRAADVTGPVLDQILKVFGEVIWQYQGLYTICDPSYRRCVRSLLSVEESIRKQFHRVLAESVSRSANSVRKLQQQIYHLEKSHNFLQLKETLSQVENFLFLFDSETKYTLSNCWHGLEIRHMFDPVFQYNRSIENYETHNYPSEKDIFRIILQLSRFFMEYAGFESYDTPVFRHPSIGGDEDDLKQTYMYQEFRKVGMLMPSSHPNLANKDLESHKYLQTQQATVHMLQSLNVQIASNKERFREFYLEGLGPFFAQNRMAHDLNDSYDYQEEEEQSGRVTTKREGTVRLIKTLKEFQEDNFQMSRSQPKYYYYKQWIWVQFPWISLSLDFNYSEMIRNCINPPTHYMSFKDQQIMNYNALKTAVQAKKSQESVLLRTLRRPRLSHKNDATSTSTALTKVRSRVTCHPSPEKTGPTLQKHLVTQKSLKSTFITQKQNQKQSSVLLPQINLNSSIRNDFKTKTTSLKTPLVDLKKVLDQQLYLNRQLHKKKKELDFKMQDQQSSFIEKEIKKTRVKIADNTSKLESITKHYDTSHLLLQKISVILNICSINKIHNLECVTPLNIFIQKLKLMIDSQQKAAVRAKEDFVKQEKGFKKQIQQLIAQANRALKMLDKERQYTQEGFSEEPSICGQILANDQVSTIKMAAKKTTMTGKSERTIKSIHQHSEESINRFIQLFGQLDSDGTNQTIMQLQQRVEEKRALTERLLELEFVHSNLLSQIQTQQRSIRQKAPVVNKVVKPPFEIPTSLNSLEEEYRCLLQKRVVFQQVLEAVEASHKTSHVQWHLA